MKIKVAQNENWKGIFSSINILFLKSDTYIIQCNIISFLADFVLWKWFIVFSALFVLFSVIVFIFLDMKNNFVHQGKLKDFKRQLHKNTILYSKIATDSTWKFELFMWKLSIQNFKRVGSSLSAIYVFKWCTTY